MVIAAGLVMLGFAHGRLIDCDKVEWLCAAGGSRRGAKPDRRTQGVGPKHTGIDPRGKFSCRFGMDSAAMTVYAIDQTKGELKPIGHYPMGTQPNWIEIVNLK